MSPRLAALIVAAVVAFAACGVSAQQPRSYPLVFGPAFDRLPAEVRSGFDARLRAVLDPRVGPVPAGAAVQAVYQALLLRGYGRLDDASLVELLRLRSTSLAKVDTASCAAYGRADTSSILSANVSQRLDSTLSADEYARYFSIQVAAIEAEAAAEGPRGTPGPFGVGAAPAAEASQIFERVIATLAPLDAKVAGAVLSGVDDTDASVCRTWRAIYLGVLKLDAASLAVYARADAVPPEAP